jgi:hypothetical protein
MKSMFLIILILTSSAFSQISEWQKIIPNTKIEVKYYTPEEKSEFKSLHVVKIINSPLGSIETFSDDKLVVVLSFHNYAEYIELSGNVENLKKDDLCFTIRVVFPIKAQKEIYWDHNPDSSVATSANTVYNNYTEANTVIPPAGSFNASDNDNGDYGDNVGIGKMSYYPIASISSSSFGLGWGIDLGLPLIYRLAFKPADGMIAEFDLATASETIKFPNSTFFRMQLFEHNPDWRFRAALSKYYLINPEYFKKRVDREGIWLPFTPLQTIKNFQDFGFAFHETDRRTRDAGLHNLSTIESDKQAGVYSFQYTEPWDIQIPIKSYNLKYDTVISSKVIPSEYQESLRNSVALDKNNRWEARKLETPWFESGCAVSITTNADPEIEGMNRYNFVRKDEINSAIKLNVDGIYFDSMEWNWHYDLNYNRAHFAFTDFPLTFSSSLEKPKPAIWNYASEYAMMRKIADEMHLKKKLVMGNGFGWMPFAPGVLDLFGAEFSLYTKSDADKTKLQFNRAISYQKPIVFLLNEGLDDSTFTKPPYNGYQQYFEKMLSFGFFPSFFSVNSSGNPYWQDSVKYNTGRPFFQKYIPLIKLIAAAGWEPVTYASAKTQDISIERFGNSIDKGLYFTVFNDGKVGKETELSIDAGDLHLAKIKGVKDLLSDKEYSVEKKKHDLGVKILIPPGRVCLLQIY